MKSVEKRIDSCPAESPVSDDQVSRAASKETDEHRVLKQSARQGVRSE